MGEVVHTNALSVSYPSGSPKPTTTNVRFGHLALGHAALGYLKLRIPIKLINFTLIFLLLPTRQPARVEIYLSDLLPFHELTLYTLRRFYLSICSLIYFQ